MISLHPRNSTAPTPPPDPELIARKILDFGRLLTSRTDRANIPPTPEVIKTAEEDLIACLYPLEGMDQQLAATRCAISATQTTSLDVSGALKLAESVLTNAATVYIKMAPENRRKFLRVLNPDGWMIERSGRVRTPTNAFVYRLLDEVLCEQKEDGTPGGI